MAADEIETISDGKSRRIEYSMWTAESIQLSDLFDVRSNAPNARAILTVQFHVCGCGCMHYINWLSRMLLAQAPLTNANLIQIQTPRSKGISDVAGKCGIFRLHVCFDSLAVAVVVTFFICWAPFHAQRLLALYFIEYTGYDFFAAMTYFSGVLYYLSTCINPLLYNIMSNKFREAFKVCVRVGAVRAK